ncbi:MAG: hypothetical protein IT481_06980 [Gammaproteobacteria bacterium]|nr:hypothetical protein [Gammaproteobacteria bacterium]
MTTPHDRDDEFESALRTRRRLVPRFDVADDAEPSSELDRLVLARARVSLYGGPASPPHTAARNAPERHYRGPRWAVPLALVATVLLSFVLVMQLDPARNQALTGAREASRAVSPPTGTAALEAQRRAAPAGAAPSTVTEAAADTAGLLPSESASGSASAPAPLTAPVAAPVPRPSPSPSAMRARAAPSMAAELSADVVTDAARTVAEKPTASASPMAAATAAPAKAAAPAEPDASGRGFAPPAPPPAPAGAAASAETPASAEAAMAATSPPGPSAWLTRIERLQQTGEIDAARAELAAFRRRFPGHPLPATLDALR